MLNIQLLRNSKIISIVVLFSIILFSCDKFANNNKIKTKDGWKEFSVNENGDSIMRVYRSDGFKKSEVTFKNGFNDGVGYDYYDNGKVHYEIHYKEGYKDGETKWFYQNGNIYRITVYEMGKKTGVQKKYYENGKIKAEIPYKDNHPVKGLKEYKKDGSLITGYPRITFKEIDKLAFENKLILEISLRGKGRKTKYYRIKKISGFDHDLSLSAQTKNGKAKIVYKLKPGQSIMEKVRIKAVTNTKMGNPLVLYKSYNLAAENRF
ncbi:MAG: hypothetical protein GXO88_07505 [Chlorobi bacterium]|nr:hypothetical protein [Chlorobiota bacterium]